MSDERVDVMPEASTVNMQLLANAKDLDPFLQANWINQELFSNTSPFVCTAQVHNTVLPLSVYPRATATSAPRLGGYAALPSHSHPLSAYNSELLPHTCILNPSSPSETNYEWMTLRFGLQWAIMRAFGHVNRSFMFVATQLLRLERRQIVDFATMFTFECLKWKMALEQKRAGRAVLRRIQAIPSEPYSSTTVVKGRHFQAIEGISMEEINQGILFLHTLGLDNGILKQVVSELCQLEHVYTGDFVALNIPWPILESAFPFYPRDPRTGLTRGQTRANFQIIPGAFVGTFAETNREPDGSDSSAFPRYREILEQARDSELAMLSEGVVKPFPTAVLDDPDTYVPFVPHGIFMYLELPEASTAPPPARTLKASPTKTASSAQPVEQPIEQPTDTPLESVAQAVNEPIAQPDMMTCEAVGGRSTLATNQWGWIVGNDHLNPGDDAQQLEKYTSSNAHDEFPLTFAAEAVEMTLLGRGQVVNLPSSYLSIPTPVSTGDDSQWLPTSSSTNRGWDFDETDLFAEDNASSVGPKLNRKRKRGTTAESSNEPGTAL
jgi:hypothetical protein